MPRSRPSIASVVASLAPHWTWVALACLAGIALTAGSIDDGLTRDDFVHLHIVRRDNPLVTASLLDMFRTDRGDPAVLSMRIDKGVYPWFTDPQLRVGFFRPAASITHALDYSLFPGHPAWMHGQNLLWYALLIAVAGALYRRVLGAGWLAALSGLLFAVDYVHGGAVGWIAGRNGLMAGAFGFAAVLLHDHASRDDRLPARVASPILLALSLLSGELGLGAIAWLIAYALWIDRGSWAVRLRRLIPHLAVALVWAAAWIGLGYGARRSGYYVDPRADPLVFLHAIAWNGPGLLARLFIPPPFIATRWDALEPAWLRVATQVAAAGIVGSVAVLGIIRDRNARFFATGMVLSVLGVCGTVPDSRLLLLASFGSVGLGAVIVGAGLSRLQPAWRVRMARVPARLAATIVLVVFGVLSPIAMPGAASAASRLRLAERRARQGAPLPADLTGRTIVLLNAPHAFIPSGWFLREAPGDTTPSNVRGLTFGPGTVSVQRRDERTVIVTPSAGFDSEPVSWLFRRPGSFHTPGERVVLSDMTARVEAVTADGRPAVVAFRFEVPIEQSGDLWLAWKGGQWVRFPVPAVGETVVWSD